MKNTMKCKGYTSVKKKIDPKQCTSMCEPNQNYCSTHLYFTNFTDEDIESIKNANGKIYVCNSCNGWRTANKCYMCVKKRERDKKARELKREQRIECDVLKHDGTKCTDESIKCTNGNNICLRHDKIDYKDLFFFKNKDNGKNCSGCRRFLNIDKFDNREQCIECNIRAKGNNISNNNIQNIEKKIKVDLSLQKNIMENNTIEKSINLCKFEECRFEAIRNKIKTQEDGNILKKNNGLEEIFGNYCGNHQLEGWKIKNEKDEKKVCSNYIRGCRNVLDENGKSKCRNCLDIDNQREKTRREKEKENAKEKEKELNKDKNNTVKICSHCSLNNNVHPLIDFIENENEYVMCIKCRIKSREQDLKRNKKEKFDNLSDTDNTSNSSDADNVNRKKDIKKNNAITEEEKKEKKRMHARLRQQKFQEKKRELKKNDPNIIIITEEEKKEKKRMQARLRQQKFQAKKRELKNNE
jgi:hypothetical protein